MNVHEIYNLLSVSHNEILQIKVFLILKQTMRMQNKSIIIKKLQLILFLLRRTFISQTILIIERFINHYTFCQRNIIITQKHRDEKLLKFKDYY